MVADNWRCLGDLVAVKIVGPLDDLNYCKDLGVFVDEVVVVAVSLDRHQCLPLAHWVRTYWAADIRMAAVAGL